MLLCFAAGLKTCARHRFRIQSFSAATSTFKTLKSITSSVILLSFRWLLLQLEPCRKAYSWEVAKRAYLGGHGRWSTHALGKEVQKYSHAVSHALNCEHAAQHSVSSSGPYRQKLNAFMWHFMETAAEKQQHQMFACLNQLTSTFFLVQAIFCCWAFKSQKKRQTQHGTCF